MSQNCISGIRISVGKLSKWLGSKENIASRKTSITNAYFLVLTILQKLGYQNFKKISQSKKSIDFWQVFFFLNQDPSIVKMVYHKRILLSLTILQKRGYQNFKKKKNKNKNSQSKKSINVWQVF